MKRVKALVLWVLMGVVFPLGVSGEEIANYAGCEVCEGAIHLTIGETKDLMGFEGTMATLKILLPTDKIIKIDLDGKLENGTKETPDEGYEIRIWGDEIFFIQDLRDESVIQMITSRAQISTTGDTEGYQPHIYLDAGHDHGILLTDSVDVAWKKLKQTRIYEWVGKAENKKEWLPLLRKKIIFAMELMGKE